MPQDESDGDHGAGRTESHPARNGPPDSPVLAELEAHWRELKARSTHLPYRSDLDPSRIAGALPHAFVLERAAPGVARLRIVGRALSTLLGTEARGLPLSVFFTPASREGLRRWLERCFEAPAILEVGAEARQGVFRSPLSGRLLILPMLDGDGQVTRALGGLAVQGAKRATIVKFDLAEAPSRLQILPRLSPPRPASVPAAPPSGMSEAPRPYLRLVVDNG